MLKDWDAFERLPEIDQMLLLEALMSTALMMTHLGEWRIAERLVSDPRCRAWSYGREINQRMNDKPRLGFDVLLAAILQHETQVNGRGN